MRYRQFFLVLLLLLSVKVSAQASGSNGTQVIADWGVISTPILSEATFTFAQYDITQNFTHHYAFSLEGDADATYEVSFEFETCSSGCGNPDLAYGVYDDSGPLQGDGTGTVLLSPGAYVFQVKGTGMGSGNSLDYWGDVTFTEASQPPEVVAPVPEPSHMFLTALGLGVMAWVSRSRKHRVKVGADKHLPAPLGGA